MISITYSIREEEFKSHITSLIAEEMNKLTNFVREADYDLESIESIKIFRERMYFIDTKLGEYCNMLEEYESKKSKTINDK